MSSERLVLASTPSLVERCVAGERQAWRELHRQYHAVAAAFLRRLGVPPGDLEDATQEVFVQVFRYLDRFEQRADLKTWIYKLCLSQAARVRRRTKVNAALRWLFRSPPLHALSPGPDWSEGEVQRRVQAALDRMKSIHRDVFVLYELEGLPGEKVAEVTGLPASTVRRRLHNARREFESLVNAGGNEEPTP